MASIVSKFQNCFDKFILNDFEAYFNIDFKRIQLIFVSKVAYRSKHFDTMRSLTIEALISKRIKFRTKNLLIKPYNPSPVIKACY